MRNSSTYEWLHLAREMKSVREDVILLRPEAGPQLFFEDSDWYRATCLGSFAKECEHRSEDLHLIVNLQGRLRAAQNGPPFNTLASATFTASQGDNIASNIRHLFCREDRNFIIFETDPAADVVHLCAFEGMSPSEICEKFYGSFLEACPERWMIAALHFTYCAAEEAFHVTLRGIAVDEAANFVRSTPLCDAHGIDILDGGRGADLQQGIALHLDATFGLFSPLATDTRCSIECHADVQRSSDPMPDYAVAELLLWLDKWSLDDMIFTKGIVAHNGRLMIQ